MRSMNLLEIGFLLAFALGAGYLGAAYFSLKKILANLKSKHPDTFSKLGEPEMARPPIWVTEPVEMRKFLMSKSYEELNDSVLTDLCTAARRHFLIIMVAFLFILLLGVPIAQTATVAT